MDNKFRNVLTLGGFIIFAIIVAILVPKGESVEILQDTVSDNELSIEDTEIYEEMIFVYIVGAVHEPGIIKAPIDSRLYEIIDLAGGATSDADLEKVNLASVVKDAQKIVIPYIVSGDSNQGEKNKEQANNGLININTASQSMLESLEGIGSSTAKKIIKYRDEIGGFSSIEELMNVTGIGESKFDAIKDDITI